MSQTISAIYENGVLRLLEPVDLPEHTRVRVEIYPVLSQEEIDALDPGEAARVILQQAGLVSIKKRQLPPDVRPLSEEERAELAERLKGIGPLSEVIIEEREGR